MTQRRHKIGEILPYIERPDERFLPIVRRPKKAMALGCQGKNK
jgi:hypothetical protein